MRSIGVGGLLRQVCGAIHKPAAEIIIEMTLYLL